MKPLLLVLLLAVPSFARRLAMTPALKARLAEISAQEKEALKPLQAREKAIRKERDARAAVLVKEHGPVKSKDEAKQLSHDISADPEIQRLEAAVKLARQDIKDKRYEFDQQRNGESVQPAASAVPAQ